MDRKAANGLFILAEIADQKDCELARSEVQILLPGEGNEHRSKRIGELRLIGISVATLS